MEQPATTAKAPGVCVPFEQKKQELPEIVGDEKLVRQNWEQVDSLAYSFIWQLVVSF